MFENKRIVDEWLSDEIMAVVVEHRPKRVIRVLLDVLTSVTEDRFELKVGKLVARMRMVDISDEWGAATKELRERLDQVETDLMNIEWEVKRASEEFQGQVLAEFEGDP